MVAKQYLFLPDVECAIDPGPMPIEPGASGKDDLEFTGPGRRRAASVLPKVYEMEGVSERDEEARKPC